MKVSKLFGVLVVGGSLLVAGACSGSDDDGDNEEKVTSGPDAAEQADPDGATAGDGDGELAPCFCDSEACCERHEDGSGTLEEGFECCWSTTC